MLKNLTPSPDLDPAAFDAYYRGEGPILAGADEAGRGPLAGPVVAAAVILDPQRDYPGVADSKKLSAAAREKAFELITSRALAWAWAKMEAREVDRLNPLKAALLSMAKAASELSPRPALILVDGNSRPEIDIPVQTVVKGDGRSLSIGAASIIAKVIRDRLMMKWHAQYPDYGFDRHKGYGTAEHLAALKNYGPCPCHRLTFKGVKPEQDPVPRLDFGPDS